MPPNFRKLVYGDKFTASAFHFGALGSRALIERGLQDSGSRILEVQD